MLPVVAVFVGIAALRAGRGGDGGRGDDDGVLAGPVAMSRPLDGNGAPTIADAVADGAAVGVVNSVVQVAVAAGDAAGDAADAGVVDVRVTDPNGTSIYDSLTFRPRSGTGKAKAVAPSSSGRGALGAEDIDNVVRSTSAQLQRCDAGHDMQGRLTFTIGTDGVVRAPRLVGDMSAIGRLCVVKVVNGWRFPPVDVAQPVDLPLDAVLRP